MQRFCERGKIRSILRGRADVWGVTGWAEAVRARRGAGLSCRTPRSGCYALRLPDRWGNL